jgi:hypothetical protein
MCAIDYYGTGCGSCDEIEVPTSPFDVLGWIQDNIKWIGIGAAVLIGLYAYGKLK